MQSELNNTSQPEDMLSEKLVADLEKVAQLVQQHAGAGENGKNSLALLRILQDVTPEEWERFACSQNLECWLSFPLQKDLTASVARLLSMQENLVYQRDHDFLTGLGNRRFFDRHLENELLRAVRSYTELSLIYIDIDDFKRVNDGYGHDCGDLALKRLAQILHTSVRHYDVVARVGGEEFAIILPASSCWTGLMLGNRLLNEFRQERFAFDPNLVLTFSAGVSSLALLNDEVNAEALLKSADKALYEAKRKGKSAVMLSNDGKRGKDQGSLVLAQEKQFLFSGSDSE